MPLETIWLVYNPPESVTNLAAEVPSPPEEVGRWKTPPPSPTRPRVARWPICEPFIGAKIFNWPDVRMLCYLNHEEVREYQEKYIWVTVCCEPILKINENNPLYRKKRGWAWPKVFEAFQVRNHKCTNVTTSRSLSSLYCRHTKRMLQLVKIHNQKCENKSLEERRTKTLDFLKQKRAPVEGEPDKSRVPLIANDNIEVYESAAPVASDNATAASAVIPGIENGGDEDMGFSDENDDDENGEDDENDADSSSSEEE